MTATLYCSTDDVYRTAGITSSNISSSSVLEFIKDAEAEIDRYTDTTYWALHAATTATAGATASVTIPSGVVVTADHPGDLVWIYSGTGANQVRQIDNNTATTITVTTAWATKPDSTSHLRIIHTGSDAYVQERETAEPMGGGGQVVDWFTQEYPIVELESLSIDGSSISTSGVYQWKNRGRLALNTTATGNTTGFSITPHQKNHIDYWYGVYPIPRLVQRYAAIYASMKALVAQIGGTFDDVTSYSLPEFTASKGEPYTNIRETIQRLRDEATSIKQRLKVYTRIW